MRRLCVVPCGKAKVWDRLPGAGPTPARAAYTGPLASATRRYAERFHPQAWRIVSARHGFLAPDDNVPGPYEASFARRVQGTVAPEVLARQALRLGVGAGDEVLVVAGSAYVRAVARAVAPTGATVRAPLAGRGGLGKMLQALARAVQGGRELPGGPAVGVPPAPRSRRGSRGAQARR
ncbi:MAG: DUF6884 domain-containing protein [Planctomycetia bacterium]